MFTNKILHHKGLNPLEAVIWWYSTPQRIAFHTLSRIVRATVTPVLRLLLAILVKRVLGLNKECSSGKASQLSLLRRYIHSFLLPQEAQKEAFLILGVHYEVVSVSEVSAISDAAFIHLPI